MTIFYGNDQGNVVYGFLKGYKKMVGWIVNLPEVERLVDYLVVNKI